MKSDYKVSISFWDEIMIFCFKSASNISYYFIRKYNCINYTKARKWREAHYVIIVCKMIIPELYYHRFWFSVFRCILHIRWEASNHIMYIAVGKFTSAKTRFSAQYLKTHLLRRPSFCASETLYSFICQILWWRTWCAYKNI